MNSIFLDLSRGDLGDARVPEELNGVSRGQTSAKCEKKASEIRVRGRMRSVTNAHHGFFRAADLFRRVEPPISRARRFKLNMYRETLVPPAIRSRFDG